MRDWRGIKAMIGDRVFYVTVDGAHGPEIHEAWVEEADEAQVLVRSTASAFGAAGDSDRETRRLKQPEDFVVATRLYRGAPGRARQRLASRALAHPYR
jgi:hypothetical protein